MVKAGGIEVYLKPVGDGSDDLRFSELESPPEDDYNGHYRRCFVPYSDEPFQIVVRFDKDFNMFKASEVMVGVGVSKTHYRWEEDELFRDRPESCPDDVEIPEEIDHRVLKTKKVTSGLQLNFSRLEGAPLRMNKVDETVFGLADERNYWRLLRTKPCYDNLNPGTIAVTVQRGSAKFRRTLAEKERENGGPRPCWRKVQYIPTTFRQLHSKNGAKYRFEFRPRSYERLAAVENQMLLKAGKPSLIYNEGTMEDQYRMLQDNEFVQAQEHTRRVNEIIEDEYQRGVQRKPPPAPRLKTPATCNCPKETHSNPSPSKRGHSTMKAQIRNHWRQRCKASRKGDSNSDTDIDEQPDARGPATDTRPAEDTVARTCSRCRNFKKPPKGKKLAWRERKARWMYVSEHAPDEDSSAQSGVLPSQDVQFPASGQDRDDEEDGIKTSSVKRPSPTNTECAFDAAGSQVAESPAGEAVVDVEPTSDVESRHSNADSPTDAPTSVAAAISTPDAEPTIETASANQNDNSSPESSCTPSRVDIDLTVDDEDSGDVIFVKSETVGCREGKLLFDGDGIENLRYKLRRIEREKRKLELEAEEEDVKRKIAQHEAADRGKVKQETKLEG